VEWEIGKFYNLNEVNENLILCNVSGSSNVYKKKDFKNGGKDDGDRYIMHLVHHHVVHLENVPSKTYRLHMIYNVSDIRRRI